jgi:hypothetical protein
LEALAAKVRRQDEELRTLKRAAVPERTPHQEAD